jgi:ankyrin repeat protein
MRHRHQSRSLFAVAITLLIGCGSPPDDSPPEEPRSAAGQEVADPAAAARLEKVRQSLEQGLDVNQADADGRTALMMAAFEGYTEVVELLLNSGAEVDHRDGAGRTAVMYASSGPFPQTVELLIQSGAQVNRIDTAEGWTALMVAAAEGHQPVVEVLLRHGADIEITDQDGDAAIAHARKRGQTHIVDLLESWPGG